MKRLIGFIMFWVAAGMLLVFLLPNMFLEIVVIAVFLILGYHLFCC